MKGNDLSNRVVPRDVVVWEGLVGLLPDPKVQGIEAKYRKRKRWDEAVACYEVNELLARKIWDITWRGYLQLDLITYLGNDFALSLEARMERENMPFSRVWATEPNILARSIVLQPDIRTIYDANPHHQFTYGGKGRILEPATAHLYLGAL